MVTHDKHLRLLILAAALGLGGCTEGQCDVWWQAACRQPYPHTIAQPNAHPDLGPGTAWPDMGIGDGKPHPIQPVVKVETFPGRVVCRNEPKYAWERRR